MTGAGHRRVDQHQAAQLRVRAASAANRSGSHVAVQSAIMRSAPDGILAKSPCGPSTTSSTCATVSTASNTHRQSREISVTEINRLAAELAQRVASGWIDVSTDHTIAGVDQAPCQHASIKPMPINPTGCVNVVSSPFGFLRRRIGYAQANFRYLLVQAN